MANLLVEREKELVLSDVRAAYLLKNLAEDTTKHKGHLQKLEKINAFGRSTLNLVISIENLFDEARSLHISSIVGSTPLSYDKLENARLLVQKTNKELVRFKKELATIFTDIDLDTRIKIEHFGTYADRPIITSTKAPTFLEKIKKSRKSVHMIREQLEWFLTLLDHEQEQVLDRLAGIEEERKRVILGAG